MGVFTITQRQYELVMGTDPTPSSYKGETRPAGVSWNDIRGDSSVYDWPNVQGVDGASFMGRLRAKTGLKFDLPTMAQWQYACRAGTESDYNNGGNAESDLKLCGRAWTDQSLPVGSFIPNAWGLYDMHGNVGQWCLDKGGEINADPVVDPMNLGSDSDPSRVFCGLSPRDNRWHPCTSSYYTLSGTGPGANTYKYSQWIYLGFRLCLIESE